MHIGSTSLAADLNIARALGRRAAPTRVALARLTVLAVALATAILSAKHTDWHVAYSPTPAVIALAEVGRDRKAIHAARIADGDVTCVTSPPVEALTRVWPDAQAVIAAGHAYIVADATIALQASPAVLASATVGPGAFAIRAHGSFVQVPVGIANRL